MENGGEGKSNVRKREREREVFEILKGGAKPKQGMRVQ